MVSSLDFPYLPFTPGLRARKTYIQNHQRVEMYRIQLETTQTKHQEKHNLNERRSSSEANAVLNEILELIT